MSGLTGFKEGGKEERRAARKQASRQGQGMDWLASEKQIYQDHCISRCLVCYRRYAQVKERERFR